MTSDARDGTKTASEDFAELLLVVARPILVYWRWIAAVTIGAAVLGVVVGLLLGPVYRVQGVFMPEGGDSQSARLAGVAAQFGFDVGRASDGESLQFYANLIETRPILESAVSGEYHIESSQRPLTLLDYLNPEGDTDQERMTAAVDVVRDWISADVNTEAGLVTFAVEAPESGLAVGLGMAILDLINRFNIDVRQSRANAEFEFVEGRVNEAEADLRAAEDSLRAFLEQNRSFAGSPELEFEANRLERQVTIAQQISSTLRQSLEQARIEQVRNTPVFTIIENPRDTVERTSRVVSTASVAAAIALILSGFIAAFSWWMGRVEEGTPGYWNKWKGYVRRQHV